MTTEISTALEEDLPPGYRVEPGTGAWLTLPWPDDLADLPPSLGPDIIRWCYGDPTTRLPAAEGPRLRHHLTGKPWRFTVGQRRFLHMWFAVAPDGEWLYRSFVKRGAKGTGKDPLCAAMMLIAALGPVVLDDWDGGRPVGRAHEMTLVQIGANSEAQAKDVLRVSNGMIGAGIRAEYYVDDGITRTQFDGAGRLIELLTRSEGSTEGDPATDNFLNETHHMTESSGGQVLATVARRNTAKSPGGLARTGEFTNAHLPGEGSVGEDSYTAWQLQVSGQTEYADILYDSREAPPHLRLHVPEERQRGLAAVYADAPWVSLRRIDRDALDPRTPPADSIRFYFNALPTNETAWVDPRKFDTRYASLVVADRDAVAVFVDCSKSEDATAYDLCRITDGHIFGGRAWQRPHGDRGKGWLAPRHEVDAEIRSLFELYDVQWLGVDPSPARDDETEASYWMDIIDGWHRDFREKLLLWASPGSAERRGHAVLFDMRLSSPGASERMRLFTSAAEATAMAIDETGDITHDGDPMRRVHVHNARRRPNQWGVSLGKATRDSKKLVDRAVTMVGARMGRRLVLNSGKKRERKRSGVVW